MKDSCIASSDVIGLNSNLVFDRPLVPICENLARVQEDLVFDQGNAPLGPSSALRPPRLVKPGTGQDVQLKLYTPDPGVDSIPALRRSGRARKERVVIINGQV